jgi:hypothetical protein
LLLLAVQVVLVGMQAIQVQWEILATMVSVGQQETAIQVTQEIQVTTELLELLGQLVIQVIQVITEQVVMPAQQALPVTQVMQEILAVNQEAAVAVSAVLEG